MASNWFSVSFPGTEKAAMKELKILRKTGFGSVYSYKMKRNPDRKGYTIFARWK